MAALTLTIALCPLCRCRWVVPLLWLPVAALLARRALRTGLLCGPVAALASGGVLLWQLIEYSMHRWLFHVVPSSRPAILAHFLMHGCAGMLPAACWRWAPVAAGLQVAAGAGQVCSSGAVRQSAIARMCCAWVRQHPTMPDTAAPPLLPTLQQPPQVPFGCGPTRVPAAARLPAGLPHLWRAALLPAAGEPGWVGRQCLVCLRCSLVLATCGSG